MRTDVRTDHTDHTTSGGPAPVARRPVVRRPATLAAVIVLVLLAALVAVALTRGSRPGVVSDVALPRGADGPGRGLTVNPAAPGAPVLDVTEDFQCPACRATHERVRVVLRRLQAQGRIRTVIHLTSGIEKRLYGQAATSSTRAAAAAACAADAGRLTQYQDAVFARQPSDEGVGYSDDDLHAAAVAAGLTGEHLASWSGCAGSGRYVPYARGVDEARAREGVISTPDYRVNGRVIDVEALNRADPRSQERLLLGIG